jgi:hypothetical protein
MLDVLDHSQGYICRQNRKTPSYTYTHKTHTYKHSHTHTHTHTYSLTNFCVLDHSQGYISYGTGNFDGQGSGHVFDGDVWHPSHGYVNVYMHMYTCVRHIYMSYTWLEQRFACVCVDCIYIHICIYYMYACIYTCIHTYVFDGDVWHPGHG